MRAESPRDSSWPRRAADSGEMSRRRRTSILIATVIAVAFAALIAAQAMGAVDLIGSDASDDVVLAAIDPLGLA